MTDGKKRLIAGLCGFALLIPAIACVLASLLGDGWTQAGFVAALSAYLLALPVVAFGSTGRWFPRYRAPKNALRGVLRGLAGVIGLGFLFVAVLESLVLGLQGAKGTSAAFAFGAFFSSWIMIRGAISGTFSGLFEDEGWRIG